MRRRNQRALSLAANTFRWCIALAFVGCDVRVSLGTNEVINDASIDVEARDSVTDLIETDAENDAETDAIAIWDTAGEPTPDATFDAATDAAGDADCIGCPWISTLGLPSSDIRRFGRSLAGNDQYVAIGASSTSGPSGSVESVFLYRVTDINIPSLELVQRLTAPAADTSRLFGRSVALSSEYLLVGSGQQVHLYRLTDLTAPLVTLMAARPSDRGYGYAVAAFDNEVHIGRYTPEDIGSWVTTYFDRDHTLTYQPRGSTPMCRQVSLAYTDDGLWLTACDSGDSISVSRFDDQYNGSRYIGGLPARRPANHEFGSIASRHDFVAVGWHPTGARGGSVQFFRAAPSWDSATAGPVLLGPQDQLNNSFGLDVAIVGTYTLVSAPSTLNTQGAEVGAIYLYAIPTIE